VDCCGSRAGGRLGVTLPLVSPYNWIMQTKRPLTPEAPQPPDAPPPGSREPLDFQRLEAINAARSELSTQLTSAVSRRKDLAAAIQKATGADRAGLEQRMMLLDERILQLEGDLATTGRIVSDPRNLTSSTEPASNPFDRIPSDDIILLPILFILFVLAPIAFAAARLLWKRATTTAPRAPSGDSDDRLGRLEQAIDSVAVEMERVSEGQRFVTRLLTEGSANVMLPGQRVPEPVGVPRREEAKVPRE